MTTPVKPPLCLGCAHKHWEVACPDHWWRDTCPYEGVDCRPPEPEKGPGGLTT